MIPVNPANVAFRIAVPDASPAVGVSQKPERESEPNATNAWLAGADADGGELSAKFTLVKFEDSAEQQKFTMSYLLFALVHTRKVRGLGRATEIYDVVYLFFAFIVHPKLFPPRPRNK